MEKVQLIPQGFETTKSGQTVFKQDIAGKDCRLITNFSTGIGVSSYGREWHRGDCSHKLVDKNGKVLVDWTTFAKLMDYFN